MDVEQEWLSMMSNDILSEAYKETLKDLDLEESVIDILTKDLICKMENKLHREITKMDDKDIHMVPPKNINNVWCDWIFHCDGGNDRWNVLSDH